MIRDFFQLAAKYYGVDWLGIAMMFLSTWLLTRKRRSGFIAGAANNMCWVIFGILAGSIADAGANAIVAGMNMYAFIAWRSPVTHDIPSWLIPRPSFPYPLLS